MEQLKDLRGRIINIGDTVESSTGKKAILRFGAYMHFVKKYIGTNTYRHIGSPAYGYYFDGDEGFFLSEHLEKDIARVYSKAIE